MDCTVWCENIATLLVRIPVAGKLESLNVSVAAGVLLYEARRQRTLAGGSTPRGEK